MGTRWYRSFYWRIGLGFIFFLAATLIAQGVIGVWLVSRSAATLPSRSPMNFAALVASDLGQALTQNASLDLQQYVENEYSQVSYPMVIVMRDGRVAAPSRFPAPETLVRFARAQLERYARRRAASPPEAPRPEVKASPDAGPPVFRRGGPPGIIDGVASGRGVAVPGAESPRAGFPGPGFMRGRRGEFGPAPAPVVVNGQVLGIVVVPPRAPLAALMRQLGPALAIVAVVLLAGGTALAAFIIFNPARRRLQSLEDATSRLGSGDLAARVPVGGADEIASVARAFNSMADELSTRAQRLDEEDRRRRQLLADVSHELGTPLTAIRGYIETLTMSDLRIDPATRDRYLGIIKDETLRLGRIVADLLDLARLESGGSSLSLQDVEVAQLFDRVVARHERIASEQHVPITTAIDPDARQIHADPDRIEQALQNLAANALRHTPTGGTVHLSANRTPSGIVLSVIDSGEGIPHEHLPHIFDRFYKADQSRASGPSSGSGLGLSIVKAIAERHGGRVSVESRPGRTAFSVTLPN